MPAMDLKSARQDLRDWLSDLEAIEKYADLGNDKPDAWRKSLQDAFAAARQKAEKAAGDYTAAVNSLKP
jgi:hypothetical protein